MLLHSSNFIKNLIKQIFFHYRCWIYYFSFVFTVLIVYFCTFSLNSKISNKTAFFDLFGSNIENNEITIIIVVNDLKKISEDYSISIPTIQCYAKAKNYNLFIIDFSNKSSFPSKCDIKCRHCNQKLSETAPVKFARHCIIAEYLKDNPQIKYVLALDADTGIINPNHTIQEYIDSSYDLTFHERRYNWEIQAATYIAKNTEFTRKFLHSWTSMIDQIPNTIENADNPALHQVLMNYHFDDEDDPKKYECQALWKFAAIHTDIRKFIHCTRLFFGFDKTECCKSKIKFYLANDLQYPAWSRDGWLTDTKFSKNDFMFHDWKTKDLTRNVRSHWKNPFTNGIFSIDDDDNCDSNNFTDNWKYLPRFKINQKALDEMLIKAQNKWRQKMGFKYLNEFKNRIK